MAVISYTFVVQKNDQALQIIQWDDVTEADTMTPIEMPGFTEKTLHVYPALVGGNWGGGSIIARGSNELAAEAQSPYINFGPLRNAGYNPAVCTSSDPVQTIMEATNLIQPVVASGTGMKVRVRLQARAPRVR